MNLLRIALPVIFFLSLLAIPNVFAADDKVSTATRTMAEIMISLRHYPSDADKDKLKKVAAEATTSANEKSETACFLSVYQFLFQLDSPNFPAITKDAATPA